MKNLIFCGALALVSLLAASADAGGPGQNLFGGCGGNCYGHCQGGGLFGGNHGGYGYGYGYGYGGQICPTPGWDTPRWANYYARWYGPGAHGHYGGYGGYGASYGGGAPTPAVTYPYYTTRGPRDFLLDNPPGLGP